MKRRVFIMLCALAGLRKARAVDIWGPIIRPTGNTSQMPQIAIGWKVLNSEPDKQTKERPVIEDLTEGVNKHVLFPDVLANMPNDAKRDLLNHIADWFINRHLGKL